MRSSKRRIKNKTAKGIEPEAKQLSSPRQESMIVDFLMKHPNLATCTIVTDVRQRDVERRLWDDLAIALNNLDGAHHSSVQWRRIWRDMKHNVRSKIVSNRAKKKNKMDNFTGPEQRIGNILLSKSGRSSTSMCKCDIESSKSATVPSVDDWEESYNESIELGNDDDDDLLNGFATEKDDYTENDERRPPQIQSILNTDTQEESQMCISKSLQDICQQNAEILQHVRQTYYLMAEDSKRQQAYQSSKLNIYRRKLELLHTKLEMDKHMSFNSI